MSGDFPSDMQEPSSAIEALANAFDRGENPNPLTLAQKKTVAFALRLFVAAYRTYQSGQKVPMS
jgi:hypothetical protein